jgi:hypothetical protein
VFIFYDLHGLIDVLLKRLRNDRFRDLDRVSDCAERPAPMVERYQALAVPEKFIDVLSMAYC